MLLQLLVCEEVCLTLDHSLFVRREDPESNGISGSHGCIVNETFSYARINAHLHVGITIFIY